MKTADPGQRKRRRRTKNLLLKKRKNQNISVVVVVRYKGLSLCMLNSFILVNVYAV
jgi:hypothetical protein